tara:strand:+ start:3586 stop:4470 length:885 start_codon:yes stop_codon:yes gene_type:complete
MEQWKLVREVGVQNGISNRNGRALEFTITRLLSQCENAQLTFKALEDLNRDQDKFDSLPIILQRKYLSASNKLIEWINDSFLHDRITIDKSNDGDSGSWDIQISSDIKKMRLSVKHNHSALKHPRPYSLAQSCGYEKGSPEDVQHRMNLGKIASLYRENAAGQILFNENPQLLHDMLAKVSKACTLSLEDWRKSNHSLATNLFEFLVSNNYYKFEVFTTSGLSANLYDYTSIKSPDSLKSSSDKQYLQMDFDNSWLLRARLHNASSKIGSNNRQLSLKYDVQKVHGLVRKITLI